MLLAVTLPCNAGARARLALARDVSARVDRDSMKISKWHSRGVRVAMPGTVSRRGKARDVANENTINNEHERHYILVDGPLYTRLETVAKARGLNVVDLVDYAIHRTLDAIYLGKARAS